MEMEKLWRFLEDNFHLLDLECDCGEPLRFSSYYKGLQSSDELKAQGAPLKVNCLNCGTYELTLWGEDAEKFNDLVYEFKFGDDDDDTDTNNDTNTNTGPK